MYDIWQRFLKDRGARINDNDHADIDITAAIVAPLSDFALLSITGEDRHSFLHGQFINDLNLIKNPAAQLSAWCNPKGRVITNFIIINTGISYLLIFKQELKAFVQKRLALFVMRLDVKIEDISETSPLIGIANFNNRSVLGSNITDHAGAVHAVDDIVIIRHPDNSGRYLMTGSIKVLTKKLTELGKTLSASSVWRLLDILAGLPWITSATQEQFLPQMLNLDALNGLSYQKGCYPGQEVIARLHYRGEVKKRVQLIRSNNELNIAGAISLASSANKVGTVINSEKHPDGGFYGLGMIELDKVGKKLICGDDEITMLALPYSIDA